MKSKNCMFRRHIRVQVEPIDIELDDDNGNLLFATLQSAFPGCSGLFYHNEKTKVKTAVKFDGQKFIPPLGDWKEREYYVQLGTRCAFPFGSYENASKQFERSVNLVSKLMTGKKGVYMDEKINRTSSPVDKIDNIKYMIQNLQQVKTEYTTPTQIKSEYMTPPASPPSIPSDDFNRTAADLEQHYSSLTPLEQQFVDLARISSAKDTIIESQRNELRTLNEQLQEIKKKSREMKDEMMKLDAKCRAQDDELIMLKNLGKEQAYMCERVNELTKQLNQTKEDYEKIITNLNLQLENEKHENKKLNVEIDEKNQKINQLEMELDEMKNERDEFINKLKHLNTKLDEQSLQFEKSFCEQADLQTSLTIENTNLLEKNETLRKKCEELTKKCSEIETLWNQKIQEAIKTEVEKNKILAEESYEQEKKISELNGMVDQMAHENNELNRRFDEIKLERDDLRRHLALLESRVKDNLSKSVVGIPLRY
uniref:TAR DNA-binding protein 43 N-terminal domain-containing protein n=1 Tax=Panagrolaimus sp. JU765 TaxID=591449 RepID=A0AC34R972_9BILA